MILSSPKFVHSCKEGVKPSFIYSWSMKHILDFGSLDSKEKKEITFMAKTQMLILSAVK